MDVIVISSEAYRTLLAEIRKTVRETVHEVAHPKSDWIAEKEAMSLLGRLGWSRFWKSGSVNTIS